MSFPGYTNKYVNGHQNPEDMGFYHREVITCDVADSLLLSYIPSFQIRGEYDIHDPDSKGGAVEGCIYLYNQTKSTDVFANISDYSLASRRLTTTAGNISVGDDVEIKYYAKGYRSEYNFQFPNPNLSFSASTSINPETLQSMTNAMSYKSPINMFSLGYRFADRLCYRKMSSTDSPWNGGVSGEVMSTASPTYYDYLVPHDEYYPFIITEARISTENENIGIRMMWERGGVATSGFLGERGNTGTIDARSTTSGYAMGNRTGEECIISVPLGMLLTDEFRIDGLGYNPYGAASKSIVMECSGYYMPKPQEAQY